MLRTLNDLVAEATQQQSMRDALLAEQQAMLSQAEQVTPEVDMKTAIGRLLAAAIPTAIGGLLGGGAGAGAVATSASKQLEESSKLDRELAERSQKTKVEKAKAYGQQAKVAGDRVNELQDNLAKPALAKAESDATLENDLMKRMAGRNIFNMGSKATPATMEQIQGTLKASGMKDDAIEEQSKQLFNNGASVEDLPNIAQAAQAIAGGRFGETPYVKALEGFAPSEKQQEAARNISEFAPKIMLNAKRLERLMAEQDLKETSVVGEAAQEMQSLLSQIILDEAQLKKRGANLTGIEIEKMQDVLGVISASQGPWNLVKANIKQLVGYEPKAAIRRYQQRFQDDVELSLTNNGYSLRKDNEDIKTLFNLKSGISQLRQPDIKSMSIEEKRRLLKQKLSQQNARQ